jgi:site-specific DNA recombinase
MIRCGACGYAVTAEHKTNRHGSRYVYYHCTKRQLGPRCPEPYIELRCLEEQIDRFLRSLSIAPAIEDWILAEIAAGTAQAEADAQARRQGLENTLRDTDAQLAELTGLRIRNMLSDEEFVAERQVLQQEQLRLRRKIAEFGVQADRFEPVDQLISFGNRAAEWFRAGDEQSKRLILETVGSNLTLKRKTLTIVAAKPFAALAHEPAILRQCGVVDDDRTAQTGTKAPTTAMINAFSEAFAYADGQRILHNIRILHERFGDPVIKSLTSRKAAA